MWKKQTNTKLLAPNNDNSNETKRLKKTVLHRRGCGLSLGSFRSKHSPMDVGTVAVAAFFIHHPSVLPVSLMVLLRRGGFGETGLTGDDFDWILESLLSAVDGWNASSLAAVGSTDIISELFRNTVAAPPHGEEELLRQHCRRLQRPNDVAIDCPWYQRGCGLSLGFFRSKHSPMDVGTVAVAAFFSHHTSVLPVSLMVLLRRGGFGETGLTGDDFDWILESLLSAVDGWHASSLAAVGSTDIISELCRATI